MGNLNGRHDRATITDGMLGTTLVHEILVSGIWLEGAYSPDRLANVIKRL